ncbi:MAG: hypothetical protein HXS46_01425 [Theionarchaea archaeon]|nr:hypothetical protein [Theionarchaea archaeon]
MKKSVLYGIAVTVLAVSLVTSVVFYKKAQYYQDKDFAAGIFDFAKRLHLADDEHPLHYEGGEHPFYETGSVHAKYSTYRFYQRGAIVSAIAGPLLALALIYYASTKPVSDES